MFRKALSGAPQPDPAPAAAAPPSPPLRTLGRGSGTLWVERGRSAAAQPQLTVTGDVTGDAEISVNIHIKGDVRVGGLTVAEEGLIEGDVEAGQVEVRGRVIGDIHARTIRLCAGCEVVGDLTYQGISIEPGAEFEGVCKRLPKPEAITAPQEADAASELGAEGGEGDLGIPALAEGVEMEELTQH